MIEEIMQFEDFKKLLKERRLDIDNLRLGVEDTPLKDSTGNNNIFARTTTTLTIPFGNNILSYQISGMTYCIPFMQDKDSEEKKKLTEWLDKVKDFCKKEFKQDIILGRWK